MLSCLHSVFLSFDSDVVMLTMVQVHVIYVSFILVCLTSKMLVGLLRIRIRHELTVLMLFVDRT